MEGSFAGGPMSASLLHLKRGFNAILSLSCVAPAILFLVVPASAAPTPSFTVASRPTSQQSTISVLKPGPAVSLAPADSFLETGQWMQAETALREYLKGHPDSAEAHFLLGYTLFEEIHHKALDQEMAQGAGTLYNDEPGRSLVKFRMEKAKESLAEFTAGAKFHAPNAFDLKIVALDYVLLGDYIDARKWLTQALVSQPGDSEGWYYLGRVNYTENRFPAAIQAFDHCLKLKPSNLEAEYNLGLSYAAVGQNAKAVACYHSAIAMEARAGKKDPEPFLDLASLYLDENLPRRAVPFLRKAAAISPDVFRVHAELGKAYSLLHQLSQAQMQLQDAVHLAPKSAPMHCMLGQVYRQEKKIAPAEAEFRACAALQRTAGGHAPMQ